MPENTSLPKLRKSPATKKTVQELLLEGQLKTGKTLIDEDAQKAKALEVFAQAAQEEARMQRGRQR
jgi:hypothetical protein